MARSNWKINFKPVYNMLMSLDKNVVEAAEDAVKAGGEIVHEDFATFFEKDGSGRWAGHYQTGQARAALKRGEFKNINGNIAYKVGFDYKKPHGLVVIFFEKGSPSLTPSPIKIITKAKNDKRIIPAMEKEIQKYIEDAKR